MNQILKILSISDLHFGKKPDPERLYRELMEVFITFAIQYKPNIIVVAGDLTDKKLTMNSDAAIYCNRFVDALTKLDCIVVLVHGTLSHDYMQINSYSHLVSSKFRIIKEATVEYIEGLRLLFLPEEYVADPRSYYEPFLTTTEKYDMAFGHGMFKFAGGYVSDTSADLKTKAYTFNSKEFKDIVHGRVSFGHIHTSVSEGNVDYNGSFSRDSHGQEEAKGFYAYDYDTQKKKCKKTFVENKLAPLYITEDLHCDESQESIDRMCDQIRKGSEKYDFYRITPYLHVDSKAYASMTSLVRELSNVTINNKFIERKDKIVAKEESVVQKENREKRDRYTGMHFLEVTAKYAKEEFGVTVTKEEIEQALIPLYS